MALESEVKMKGAMTGRERLTRTFKGEEVDRISVSPFIWANNIYEMFKYTPTIDKNLSPDDFDLPEKYMEYHDHFGFDVLFYLIYIGVENYQTVSTGNPIVTTSNQPCLKSRIVSTHQVFRLVPSSRNRILSPFCYLDEARS